MSVFGELVESLLHLRDVGGGYESGHAQFIPVCFH